MLLWSLVTWISAWRSCQAMRCLGGWWRRDFASLWPNLHTSREDGLFMSTGWILQICGRNLLLKDTVSTIVIMTFFWLPSINLEYILNSILSSFFFDWLHSSLIDYILLWLTLFFFGWLYSSLVDFILLWLTSFVFDWLHSSLIDFILLW